MIKRNWQNIGCTHAHKQKEITEKRVNECSLLRVRFDRETIDIISAGEKDSILIQTSAVGEIGSKAYIR